MDPLLTSGAAWPAWQGRVASLQDLAACVAALGVLPLQAPAPWPALPAALAPGVTLPAAWAWAGTLVDRREVFSGRVLPGLAAGCLAALPVFALAFARGPGSDPLVAYSRGAFDITGKAVVDLLRTRGPLTLQQIRLGLGQHKRFLIHDTPQVMDALERGLVVVPVGPEYRAAAAPAAPTPRPRSRFNPPSSPDLALRAWELTVRWAPPVALAAADRLREERGQARALLRTHLRLLNAQATATDLDTLLGEDSDDDPATPR